MIAAKVREIRKSLKLTQGQFATLLGCSRRAVESWEEGLREPRGAMMLKILEVQPILGFEIPKTKRKRS